MKSPKVCRDKKTRQATQQRVPTSTVGRARSVVLDLPPETEIYQDADVDLRFGDSLDHYNDWPAPSVIVSDGGYGILGFEGDTSDHLGLPDWYEPHIAEWSKAATPETTLWFWNSEIGWAVVHPILEKYGWRYQNCNIWDKGMAHVAGNVNTRKIRRFPVVSEICVQYVLEARVNGLTLKEWLLHEWKRTGLPLRKANEACGVRDAAVRKYLDQGHLWYFPPPEKFERMQIYANKYGASCGRPYFALNGKTPSTAEEWLHMRSKFNCPHGVNNIWHRSPVNGGERLKAPSGKAVHLNQKPLDLMMRVIAASSDSGDVVWEPFGGLFTASLAAKYLGRKAYSCEIDSTYFQYGVRRFSEPRPQRFGLLFPDET
jgi:site-specific DNA-methyltransferase (adenine-specific)